MTRTDYTIEEFIDALGRTVEGVEYEEGDSEGSWWGELDYSNLDAFPFGTVTVVKNEGGGEGGTEEVVVVLQVTHPDTTERFFQKYGSYYSHDGWYWEGPVEEVTPRAKVITVYEVIN
jgi:hypothetical protein